jgi:glycine betaine/proline transport system ATP-binding protein
MNAENGKNTQDTKIRVENLVMIFGKSPHQEALPMLKSGETKEEILSRTGHVVGVADVSFSVKEGEIFVVMGLSGSGKSTLIRCINRIIEPTSGQIYVDDEDVLQADTQRLRELRRTKMAMVFQHFALLPHKTVLENVAFGLKIRGVDQEEQRNIATDALDMVGLKPWANKRPANLSGGMKQRVGLARALANDADILLMDEAFGALDPLIRRQMQNELMELQTRLKKTVLFITHDLNEALRVGNHVAIMRDGYMAQVGDPVEIITKPADDYVAAFIQEVDQSRVLTAQVVMQPANEIMIGKNAMQTALKRAKSKDDASAYYVVDGHQKVEGLIRRQNILRAENEKSGGKDFAKYIERDYPTASHDATIADLYALVANGVPVAITDAENRLLGVVTAGDILSGLANVEQISDVDPNEVLTSENGQQNGEGQHQEGDQQQNALQETVEADAEHEQARSEA